MKTIIFNIFWNTPIEELLKGLQTNSNGLTGEEARQRILRDGKNLLSPQKHNNALMLFIAV